MKKVKASIKSIVFCLMIILAGSCGKTEKEKIELPPTSVLTIRTSWGVVTSNFLRLRDKPSRQANVLAGIPMGIVFEILSNTEVPETIDKQTAYWYRIDFDGLYGWVFGAYLEVFNSKNEAEKFAREMK